MESNIISAGIALTSNNNSVIVKNEHRDGDVTGFQTKICERSISRKPNLQKSKLNLETQNLKKILKIWDSE